MGIAQIEHIALATSRLEAMCDFYRLLGGVALPLPSEPGERLRGCSLDFLGVRLEVLEEPSPRLLRLGFALGCADAVDELSLLLAAAGHPVPEPPRRSGGLGRYESVVLDPDGNRIELGV